jgi:SH3 domain protein
LKIIASTLLLLFAVSSSAQEIRYISDKQYVPIRSGQGTQFRIVHQGLPSGMPLVIGEVNEETGYTQVTTPGGQEGWILNQYLMAEEPARIQLDRLLEREAAMGTDKASLRQQYIALDQNYQDLGAQLLASEQELGQVNTALNELRRISENAVKLDSSNRRLIEESEILKGRTERVEADNRRMQENRDSDAFWNGVLAVLIGVLITLLAPRLWPRRRSSSSSSWA